MSLFLCVYYVTFFSLWNNYFVMGRQNKTNTKQIKRSFGYKHIFVFKNPKRKKRVQNNNRILGAVSQLKHCFTDMVKGTMQLCMMGHTHFFWCCCCFVASNGQTLNFENRKSKSNKKKIEFRRQVLLECSFGIHHQHPPVKYWVKGASAVEWDETKSAIKSFSLVLLFK